MGFRINDTFANLAPRVGFNLLNITSDKYQVQLYPGSTLGTMFFALFVYDDYFLTQPSALARLTIDGVEQDSLRQIVIQCEKRTNYFKNLAFSNGTFATSVVGSPTYRAGDTLSVKITGLQDYFMGSTPNSSQFMPFDRGVYVNGTVPLLPVSVIDDNANKLMRFNFTLATAGQASLFGSGFASPIAFNVLPGPISAAYTIVTGQQLLATAGSNVTILISLAD